MQYDIELCDNAIFHDELIVPQKRQDSTPMKSQYKEIKRYFSDDIVLFQRGNFYQAYDDDARIVRQYIDLQWKIPDQLVGLSEYSVAEHVLTLVQQTDKRIVICEQSTFQKNENIFDRFVTGIYSKGLLGFGMLGDCNLESNYLVSLYGQEAIVIDTISKVAYTTNVDNLNSINISEIITNEKYKCRFKSRGIGVNAYEQLENYFKERCIDGISQITFLDTNDQQDKFCRVTDATIYQLFFKPLIKPVTKEGQRKLTTLLKRIPIDDIRDRQLANKDVKNFQIYFDGFQDELKHLSLQHQMARVFNAPKDQLTVKKFLHNFKYILSLLKSRIYINKENYKSKILSGLCEYTDDTLQLITDQFLWEGEDQDLMTPKNEERVEYMNIFQSIEDNQAKAYDEFLRIHQQYDARVTYSNFEIEMPEDYKTTKELIFSNKRRGYRKYTCLILQRCQQKHIQLMDQLKKYLQLFYQKIIDCIIKNRQYFSNIIDQLSYLDVQISMSKLDFGAEQCTPQICDEQEIELIDFRHPLIDKCVANSLVIRDCITLTGYNGAGKSTLLRSVGLLVILGSLGCDVPCRFMKFKPLNEIHCRMGAYDNIRESTFYTELKEVRNMIDKKNSLLLIDELGRGTSSIDGHAIAYGILKYLLKQQSIILFATHFDITLSSQIYHMDDYYIKKGQVIKDLTSRILK